ncbi:MAG: CHAP domain-containing protein [Candidatus Absconditabacterales bacterium]
MRRKKKLALHEQIHHHLSKHFHRHVHKVLHVTHHAHHNFFHVLELVVICIVTLTGFGFTNLTGLNQDLYRSNAAETADHLLSAMQNPTASLKLGNIISVWNMDMEIENSFAKGYCTYGAARVSPEFFPFTDPKTQQRTRGGNAVDRCKNASDTGYKIGSVPSQGALVVYDAGGRFGSYGHVGKVLHYDRTLKKIIVRDMARVARGQMSDRREDLTTAQVKCYIYNSKTSVPTESLSVPTESLSMPTIPNTPLVVPTVTPTIPTVIPTTPVVSVVIPTPPHNAPTTTPVTPTQPIQITTPVVVPTVPVVVSQGSVNKELLLEFENLSDIAEHFMTQNNVTIRLVSKMPLKLGEVATLTLEIKDKKTGEPYSGLLPFSFTILSTNDSLQADISNIQMINNGLVNISILGQKFGTAAIVISMDTARIGEFDLEVK